MTCSAKKPRLWFAILTLLTFVGWAAWNYTSPRGQWEAERLFRREHANGWRPLLKDYDTYQASLPVRELRNGSLLTLHHLPFYARITDLNSFAVRMSNELGMRTSVGYITAASHSGKSASVVVGFLRSRELDFGDDARLNFTHLTIHAICQQRWKLS